MKLQILKTPIKARGRGKTLNVDWSERSKLEARELASENAVIWLETGEHAYVLHFEKLTEVRLFQSLLGRIVQSDKMNGEESK